MPVDVAEFVARREACDALVHYRPTNADDMHQTARDRSQMCDGQERDRADLRRSYSSDPRILRVLSPAVPTPTRP